jgi:SAM-dependent methyltransferase
MDQFKNYSKYYDTIYSDKDYKSETEFILNVLRKYSQTKGKNLLSLGCGTCTYELLMAKKGYRITGIDKSTQMLDSASKKIKAEKLDSKIKIFKKDVRRFSFNEKFNNAMAMFNIIGYQTNNSDLEKTFRNVNANLKKGGLFVFDCWYMPAVLKDRPTDRVRSIKIGDRKIIRLTKSRLDLVKNIIEINFDVIDILKSSVVSEIKETHEMRYWSLPELAYFLDNTGFEIVKTCDFMDENSEISENNWNIFVVARKR